MIKKLLILLVLATSFYPIIADEPDPNNDTTQGTGPVRRSTKGLKGTTLTVTFRDGVLRIASACDVGNVTIRIINVHTAEENDYTTNFPEAGTEWNLVMSDEEYFIEIDGENIHWQYYL